MNKPLTLLLSIPVILAVLFLVAVNAHLEDEGIYGCYMDVFDMEYCKDREQVYTYEECVTSVMKDWEGIEDSDAIARNWCGESFNVAN